MASIAEMKEIALIDFLGEPGARFEVPRFQRAYSWEAEQCDELWRDLGRAARAGRAHFAGAIMYLDESRDGAVLSIVDGQQRLTTASLIVAALAGYLRESGETLYGMGADDLIGTFLVNGSAAKLTLSRVDRDTFDAIAEGRPLPDNPSQHVVENLDRFASKMREPEFDALALWKSLSSLKVIAIALDERQRACDVFESLNARGVRLTTADLVRNHLLLAESRAEQARLFEKWWEPIQGAFGDDPGSIRLDNAILGWLSVRFREVRKFGSKQAFSIFKAFCEDEYDGTTDALLEELYAFCLVWAENYRYHAVKKYKAADWARLGSKTRVSGRALVEPDNPESREYYRKHFGVDPKW